jgi:hypothetical protein
MSDLGRPFFADLNFDGFRGLQNGCRQRKKVASRGKIRLWKTGLIEGNKAHLNMHIYYRLMTRQNYQTTVGKRSLTPTPTRRGLAPPLYIYLKYSLIYNS